LTRYPDSGKIASELSTLLRYDPTVLFGYLISLEVDGPVNDKLLSRLTGIDEQGCSRMLDKMLADGLVIEGSDGYLPLHPRLALSNLYRLALEKDQTVRASRVRLDALTALLVKRREEVQGW
jgi:hypothetical protein